MIRRLRLVLGLVLGLAALAGCSSSGAGSASGAAGDARVTAPAGLTVSVLQYRSDYSLRRIQIKVSNAGSAPLTVVGARLASPLLRGVAVWTSRGGSDDALIGPGEATDLPAALPPSACSSSARSSPSSSSVAAVRLRLADGTQAWVEGLPVRDPFSSVGTVHDDDCRRSAALAIADLELVQPLATRTEKGALVGYLGIRVTPTGAPGRLRLESVGSTTLLDPPDHTAWPLGRTFTSGTPATTLTLRLQPARCDPHAIAEDKLGTVLPVTLRVNSSPPGIVTLVSPTPLKTAIQNFVLAACR